MPPERPTRPAIQYQPRRCPFLQREVWAILTQQADGRWQVVNCLDKDDVCYEHPCAFTTDGGTWPFEAAPSAAE